MGKIIRKDAPTMQATHIPEGMYYTPRQVSRILGVTPGCVSMYITRGELPAIITGNRVLVIKQIDVVKLMEVLVDPGRRGRKRGNSQKNQKKAES